MSNFSEQLNRAASKNSELLGILQETNYAPPAYTQNESYIADLKNQIAKTESDLKKYHVHTEIERKDHLRYKDSIVKRYAYKLGGSRGKESFASKSEKEEREFLEAWQREKEAQDALEELQTALANATSQHGKLEKDKQRCEQAQSELDRLYSSIFSGPTPQVPGEDQIEQEVQQARAHFDECQKQFNNDKQAFDALMSAGMPMKYALSNMDDARGHSQMDMLGGGTFMDMMERDSLHKGQNQLTNALRHYDAAMRAQPAIQPLNEVNIDHGHLMSDVLFDNIFSDMAQHDRIKSAQAQMEKAGEQLKEESAKQDRRTQEAKGRLDEAGGVLEEARKRLQGVRSEAFEQYAGKGAPPAYSQ